MLSSYYGYLEELAKFAIGKWPSGSPHIPLSGKFERKLFQKTRGTGLDAYNPHKVQVNTYV